MAKRGRAKRLRPMRQRGMEFPNEALPARISMIGVLGLCRRAGGGRQSDSLHTRTDSREIHRGGGFAFLSKAPYAVLFARSRLGARGGLGESGGTTEMKMNERFSC